MSELSEGFTVYPQVLKNIRVINKADAQNDYDIQSVVKAVTEKQGDSVAVLFILFYMQCRQDGLKSTLTKWIKRIQRAKSP